jgi:hypothetical protein
MDIETEIGCNRVHGLVLSSCSLDDSERIRRPRLSRQPVSMEGNHIAFFNSEAEAALRAVVHKV